MSWKKGVFSNLMWGAYTLITAVALVETCAAAATALGGASFLGPVAALVLELMVVGSVYLIHRLFAGEKNAEKSVTNEHHVAEADFAVLFLVLGFVIRVSGIKDVISGGAFYEAAMVAEGRSVPDMVHGASNLYLQLLHMVFMLVGNKLSAGIWFQVVLQLLAIVLLYFAVRKLAGVLPAVVMFVFLTCMEPAVQGALTLSPEPLYLLLFAVGLSIVAACRGKVRNPVLFLLSGLWIGLMGYLDVSGFILFVFAAAAALERLEEEMPGKTRAVAVIACLTGTVVCFLGTILADAFINGESFANVLKAWGTTFANGGSGFSMDSLNNGLIWEIPLFFLMFFGVISYWSNREREYISIWMFVVCLLAGAQYCGILTEELPFSILLIICMTVLAGVGIRASFGERRTTVVRKKSKRATVKQEETIPVKQEELENLPFKLPKYLQEPGSTNSVKIPKYLQEEMAASKPAPKPKPAEPVQAEEPLQAEMPVQAEEPLQAEMPVQAEEPLQTEAPIQTEYAVTEPDIQDMYGVPEKFRPKTADMSQDTDTGLGQPESAQAGEPERVEAGPAQAGEPERVEAGPMQAGETEEVAAEPAKAEGTDKAEAAPSKPRYIENPMPLPKPHQKKVLDYDFELSAADDFFDIAVDENDDFDMK